MNESVLNLDFRARDFQQSDFAMMDTNNHSVNYKQPYIINESLAKKIGWTAESSIGREVENRAKGPVVGVVKDFNFSSLHEPIGPLLIFLGRDFSRTFMVRINGNDMQSTLGRLETVWKQRITDRPFVYHFLNDDYNKLYLAEQRTSSLFSVAAGLALRLVKRFTAACKYALAIETSLSNASPSLSNSLSPALSTALNTSRAALNAALACS